MIPVEKMIVLWDTNDKEQITELAVEHISHQPVSTRTLLNSAGSCNDGWLGENPIDNPIGLFFLPRRILRFFEPSNCDARAAPIRQGRRPKLGERNSKTQRGENLRGRRGRIVTRAAAFRASLMRPRSRPGLCEITHERLPPL
jgi:hypothetical protein